MPDNDKKPLRERYLALRQAVTAKEATDAAYRIARYLTSAVGESPRVVAGYRAVRGEADIFPALQQLSRLGHTLCLPVVESVGKPLLFRRWPWNGPLEKGAYGIDIPAAAEPAVVPDVLIVPLVAFDAAGHRLGYGAGFYDQTIQGLRQSGRSLQIIGAAYACQQVEALPAEAHDERLDAVVTEKGLTRFT